MKCPVCGIQNNVQTIKDTTVYCYVCGAPLNKMIVCPNCNRETLSDSKFCEFCGSPIEHKRKEDN